ncbi:MAG: transposase [Chloroflexi bacterium]|nr:transposase [Chloroflexota bacterium]MCL5108703.1 transposase [Chloroflexota bacterium]
MNDLKDLYPSRRTTRLPDYDYSWSGAYFVTVCTHGKACLFGEQTNAAVALNDLGRIVEATWLALPEHFPSVRLDAFVVMPNHVHGVLLLSANQTSANAPALGTVVGAFKSAVSRRLHEALADDCSPIWQQRFYEHVVRGEADLQRLREYIANNPLGRRPRKLRLDERTGHARPYETGRWQLGHSSGISNRKAAQKFRSGRALPRPSGRPPKDGNAACGPRGR